MATPNTPGGDPRLLVNILGKPPTNGTQTMTYTVSCLASLSRQCLIDLLATPAEILSMTQADGFATIVIKCDAATADVIAERYHISEV
jgi:hypothetical protein